MTAPDRWRKPSRCDSGTCVEVKTGTAIVLVRNSTEPTKVLAFTKAEWAAFLAGAKDGEFDLEP